MYLAQDRRRALARGETLPDRTFGSALFADISGFTPLTESLSQSLGARRGVEELTKRINAVYDALIAEAERCGGSVISFAGDAITCWFDSMDEGGSIKDASAAIRHLSSAVRAVACAAAMQAAMHTFPDLALKVAVATGNARRFVVGDPSIQLLDTLAGATLTRLAVAEHIAQRGEIVVDAATAEACSNDLHVCEWREDAETQQRFAVCASLTQCVETTEKIDDAVLPSDDVMRSWVLPAVYAREQSGHGEFLTELRPCVALFVRFTGIDYDADEHAGAKLDAFMRLAQHTITRFEGVLLDLNIGDKGSYLNLAFGALSTHEDDARRATKAALSLHAAATLPLQIGVTQGVMYVGAYGGRTRRTYGALGDEVNLAARLMATAQAGEILISGSVQQATANDFVFEPRPPLPMKGKAEPLAVFVVAGERQQRAIRLQEPTYALPMVGRQSELQTIGEKLDVALQGNAQIIGIVAEAGMGKSRLVAEVIRLAHKQGFTGYGGACQSDAINTPYQAWKAIWSAFFDVDPSAPLRKQIRLLEGEIEDRAPERLQALPLLAPLLNFAIPDNDFTKTLEPKDRKGALHALLADCLKAAAKDEPHVLIIEDLHWIDALSHELLDELARALTDSPVFFVLAYRPPQLARLTAPRLEALPYFTKIELSELNAAECEQAIRAKLAQLYPARGGAVPLLLVEKLMARAQGNPFYVEELLNFLRDRGLDPRDRDDLNKIELPDSLYTLILSRIDQLSESEKTTLRVASIIGRLFRVQGLLGYYPALGDLPRVMADLDELQSLDITPLETPEPELAYLFKHIVTHEVTYESLSYATRAQLHGQYALYLESAYPERTNQLAPQLAHHFEQAQIRDKACVYLAKAGEQAAGSYANDEALSYFTRALNLTPIEDKRGRFDTLLKRERVYDLLGKRAEQRRDLAELTRLADQFDDAPILRAQLATRMAKLEIDVGEYAAAKTSAQAAIREIEADANANAIELMVDALLLEARAMYRAGEAAAAKPILEDALSRARAQNMTRGEYNALAQLGMLYWHGGEYSTAADLLHQSLSQIRDAGDVRRELDLLNNLGVVANDQQQFADALAHYAAALQIAHKIGDRAGEASLLSNMGKSNLDSRDFVHAATYSEQGALLAAEVNDRTVQAIALINRGEAYRELGDYAAARTTAVQALTLIQSVGYRRGEAIVLDNMALLEFSVGNRAQAIVNGQTALTIAREIGARHTEASALLHLGLIYIDSQRFDIAEQALNAARSIAHDLGEKSLTLEVQAAEANLALARGGTADAVT